MDLNVIKEQRVRLGLTVSELSRRSGVDRRLLDRMERGVGNPSHEAVCRVMGTMGFMLYWAIKDVSKL